MLSKDQLLRTSVVVLTLGLSTSVAMAEEENTDSCAPPAEPCPAPQAEPMQPQPTYEPMPEPPQETPMQWADKYGVEVALGGGVEGFTSNAATDFTDTGGGWNVHVGIGNTKVLGFEAAYIGSAQGIDALGLDSSAVLVGNGAQAVARVNFMPDYTIRPFAIAGAAWRHYNLTNADFNTSDVLDSADVLEIPLGAGVAATYAGFLFDLRGEFRAAVASDDLLPDLRVVNVDDNAALNRWGFNANIGYQF